MKKLLSLTLAIVLAFALVIPTYAADKVQLSQQKLSVNDKDITCEKYNINGSNYFKLRDLAYILSGTENQFEVGYSDGVVTITTGQAYTSNGSELVIGKDKSSTAVVSKQTIMINGVKNSSLSAYNIGGNNFFKLRDLGNVVGFNVDFNQSTNTAIVTTGEVTTKQIKVVDKEIETYCVTTYSYDNYGNVISEVAVTSENETYKTTYKYDANGNVIEYVNYAPDNTAYTETYEYDSNNNRTKETIKYSNGDTYTAIYTYDSHNNSIKGEYIFYENGITDSVSDTTTYKYDSNGNVIEESFDNYTIKFTYDANGNKIKESIYVDGEHTDDITYTYDSKGNLIEYNSTDDSTDTKIVYTYDANGNLIKRVRSGVSPHEYSYTTTYTYDSDGYLIKEAGDSNVTYTYKTITVNV